MKQKIITVIFFLTEGVVSFFAWQSLYLAVLSSGASHFLVPAVFFSLLAIILLLGVSLFPLASFRIIALCIATLPVFFFGSFLPDFLAFVVASLCCYWSLKVIDRELSEHLIIRFFSSVRMGTFLLSLGFSVMIAVSYFGLISRLPADKLFPRFSLADGTGKMALQIAGRVNPAFSRLGTENLTIDEFVLNMMPQDMGQADAIDPLSAGGGSENTALRSALESVGASRGMSYEQVVNEQRASAEALQKALFLKETKRRLTEMLGREVNSNEPAKSVLSELINAKIFGSFSSVHAEGSSVVVLRSMLALLLFLSLLSAGPLLGFVWAFFAWILFWILQGGNIIAIRRVPVEAEQIVLI